MDKVRGIVELYDVAVAAAFTAPSEDDRTKISNTVALVSPVSDEPLWTYSKQRLVPVAESFGTSPGTSPLPIAEAALHDESAPARRRKKKGGRQNDKVHASVAPAICHDVSFPGLFFRPSEHAAGELWPPALLISPASVPTTDMALTSLSHACYRALEQGIDAVMRCNGSPPRRKRSCTRQNRARHLSPTRGAKLCRPRLPGRRRNAYGDDDDRR
jgi:apolipoprotein N-acyltransferase